MLHTSRILQSLRLFVLIGAMCSIAACSSLVRKPTVPKAEEPTATIAGLQNVRYLPITEIGIARMSQDLLETEANRIKARGGRQIGSKLNFLSISGGGDNGAFGAGLLNGWTAQGTRPNFDLVTGISTGALIAPFAFVGPEYDFVLKMVYTETSPKDIYEANGITSVLF